MEMSRWLYPFPPSFPAYFLVRPLGLLLSSSRIFTLSPRYSFQVIDVPHPLSNPSAQQQEKQSEQLWYCSCFIVPLPAFFRSWVGPCHGHPAPLDCQVWHHLCRSLYVRSDPYLVLGLPSFALLRPTPPRLATVVLLSIEKEGIIACMHGRLHGRAPRRCIFIYMI